MTDKLSKPTVEEGRMPRRLSPEARRAEIIATARALIAQEGYRSLSLREVARRCDMSAPGLMHHFADMPSLLDAVLASRDDDDISHIMGAAPEDATFDDVVDAAFAFYADDPEVPSFDALEAEAIDPTHPAHAYFVDRDERVYRAMRPIIDRHFQNPDQAYVLLRVVVDGLRLRRMRDPENYSLRDGWYEVRDAVYAASPPRQVVAFES